MWPCRRCSRLFASGSRCSSSRGSCSPSVVTTLIAIQLFRDFARHQTLHDLRRESAAIAQLYSSAVAADFAAKRGDSRRAPTFAREELEQATGDKIYFDGPVSPFPGENPGPAAAQPPEDRLDVGEDADVHLHAAAARRRLLRGREPGDGREHATIGAIVVAKKKTAVN